MGKVRRTTPGQLYGNAKKLNRSRAKQLRNNTEENEQEFFTPEGIQKRQEHTRHLWQLCTNKNLDEIRLECWKVRKELGKMAKDSDLLSIEVEDSLDRVQKEHTIFQNQLDKGVEEMKEANSNWKNMKNSQKNLESDIDKVKQRLDNVIKAHHELHDQYQQIQQKQQQSTNDGQATSTSSQGGSAGSPIMDPKKYQQLFEDVKEKVDKELSSFHTEFKSLFKENKELCDKMERKLAMVSEACLEQVNGATRQANYAFQETQLLKNHMNDVLRQFQACMEHNKHMQNQLTSLQTQVNANRIDPRLEQNFHDLETDFLHVRSDFYAYRKTNDDLQLEHKAFITQKAKEVAKELYQALSADSRHHIRENKKLQHRLDQLTSQGYNNDQMMNGRSLLIHSSPTTMKRRRTFDGRSREVENDYDISKQHFTNQDYVALPPSSPPRSPRYISARADMYGEASKRRRFHPRSRSRSKSRNRGRSRSRSRSRSRPVQPQEGERDRSAVGSLLFGDISEKPRRQHRMQLNEFDFDLGDRQIGESRPSVSEENSEDEDQLPPVIVIEDVDERGQREENQVAPTVVISTAAENQEEKPNQMIRRKTQDTKLQLRGLDICLEDVRLCGLLYFCYGGAVNLEATWMSYFAPLDQEDCVAMSDLLQLQRRFPALHMLPVYFSQFLVQACTFKASNRTRQDNERSEAKGSTLKNFNDVRGIYHSLLEEIYYDWMKEIPQQLMQVYESFGGNPSGMTFEMLPNDVNPQVSNEVEDSFKNLLELKLDVPQETMILLTECPPSVYLFVTLFDSIQVHRMCPQKGTYRLNRIGSDVLTSLWEVLLSKLPYDLFMDISWLDRQTKGQIPILGFCHLIAVLLLEYGSILQGHIKSERGTIADIVQLLFDSLRVNGKQAKDLQDLNILLQDEKETIEFVDVDSKLISLLAMDSFFEVTATLCGSN